MAGNDQISQLLSNELIKATKFIENTVDQELRKLDELGDMTSEKFNEEIDVIRAKRLAAMKKEAEHRRSCLNKGHCNYDTLTNEKEFFEAAKNSDNVVVHYFESDSVKSKVLDHHFKTMCLKHFETKFVRIEVEKVPYLRDRLGLKTLPALYMIKDNKVKGKIIDLREIEGIDEYSYRLLEWKIAKMGVINYKEDLSQPPEKSKESKSSYSSKRTIRETNNYSSDSE